MTTFFLRQRLSKRVFLVLLLHAAVFALAYWLAYAILYDFQIPDRSRVLFFLTLPAVLVLKLAIFYSLGNCHGWWRMVTFSDLAALLRASTISAVVILAFNAVMSGQSPPIPANAPGAPAEAETPAEKTAPALVPPAKPMQLRVSIVLLDWGLTILILGGLRCLWRLSREEILPALHRRGAKRALIVGASNAGESLARQLQSDSRINYHICGFLDTDTAKHGLRLAGIPVLGGPEHALGLAAAWNIEDVLMVSGVLSGAQARQLMRDCAEADVRLRVIPNVDELLNAKSKHPIQIRDIDINDLLRRDAVELNNESIGTLLEGRVVLVTGAGGSIGSEICRQVLRFSPRKLILVERAENNLFLIDSELRGVETSAELVPAIADILDLPRMEQIFERHRPEVVFHAAAHKHVPMMEHNPGEAIKNNVLGTRQLADLSRRFGVRNFVMISTDKAVNPTSIMGVSKQLAERFVHALSEHSATKFVVVRFGNVLASAGSVVPIFQDQIRRGGPVTVTHPDIERFFMTIPEASQLVLQAAGMGAGGEIFVLDMGEPVKIVDLARDLIRLSGLSTDDIEIAFTGLRPGEKLYEELYFENEETLPTPHPKVFVAYHRPFTLEEVDAAIAELLECVHGDPEVLRSRLREILPEYRAPAPQAAPSPADVAAPIEA